MRKLLIDVKKFLRPFIVLVFFIASPFLYANIDFAKVSFYGLSIVFILFSFFLFIIFDEWFLFQRRNIRRTLFTGAICSLPFLFLMVYRYYNSLAATSIFVILYYILSTFILSR